MPYGGESNAKKIARLKTWAAALCLLGDTKPREQMRALVLAGPCAGDIRTLTAVGFRPENITAVDLDPSAIAASRSIEPNADYVHGDILDTVTQRRRKLVGRRYDIIFLDYCSPISAREVTRAVRVAKEALINGGVFITGFMYGREGETTRPLLNRFRDDFTKHISQQATHVAQGGATPCTPAMQRGMALMGGSREDYDLGFQQIAAGMKIPDRMTAAMARVNMLQGMVLSTALDHGMVLFNVGYVSYRSGRRNSQGHSAGTPMLYYMAKGLQYIGRSPRRKMVKDYMSATAQFDRDETYYVMILPDDPDGDYLKKEATSIADRHGSAITAELLGLKRQQVAAWLAWHTMRSTRKTTEGKDEMRQKSNNGNNGNSGNLHVVEKPFVQMGHEEFEQEWDKACRDNDIGLLQEAGTVSMSEVAIVCVVLTELNGTKKLVTYHPEYGDDDGVDQAKEFCARLKRRRLLQLGQRLDIVLVRLPTAHIFAHGEIIK